MGKYSKLGSNQFDRKIDQEIEAIITHLKAMPDGNLWEEFYLLGGYGRGEGTVWRQNTKELPFNDYDFVLVSKPQSFWKLRNLRKKVKVFAKESLKKISVPVDLYVHTPDSLQSLELSLFNYEMIFGSKHIFGQKDYLQILQENWKLKKIPLSEGMRLLLNRGTLLLYNQVIGDKNHFAKYIHKAHLAMGDALLIALGQYDLLYANKGKQMESITLFPKIKKWYLQAIELKNEMDEGALNALVPLMNETVDQYITFYLWFEEKRLGVSFPSLDAYAACRKGEKSAKSFVLNTLYSPDFRFALLHPRERLSRALLYFLKKEPHTFFSLESFIRLRERFG